MVSRCTRAGNQERKRMGLVKARVGYTNVLLLLLTLLVASTTCFGQASGSITGIVSDPHGAIVPGANVTLLNVSTKETRSAVSGADGRYAFSLLIPGSYDVIV